MVEEIVRNVLEKIKQEIDDGYERGTPIPVSSISCIESTPAVQSNKLDFASSYEFDKTEFRERNDDEVSLIDIPNNLEGYDDDDDSELEFNRILDLCDQLRRKDRNYYPLKIEHEYDLLPKMEQLSIHVDEDVPLESVGRVIDIIDCLVIVESQSTVSLDMDTVLFNADRDAIGKVFDVMGTISKPIYAILFNTPQEANQFDIGLAIYYVPNFNVLTHTVRPDNLSKEKLGDFWDGEGECPSDLMAFSDDEAEQNYFRKRRGKKVSGQRSDAHKISMKRNWNEMHTTQVNYGLQNNTSDATNSINGRNFGNSANSSTAESSLNSAQPNYAENWNRPQSQQSLELLTASNQYVPYVNWHPFFFKNQTHNDQPVSSWLHRGWPARQPNSLT